MKELGEPRKKVKKEEEDNSGLKLNANAKGEGLSKFEERPER